MSAPEPDLTQTMASRRFVVLLVLAGIVGVVAALASWCFLELAHLIQEWAFVDAPKALGYDRAPLWWPLPVAGLAGLIVAYAIVRRPGGGGHVPARGLSTGVTAPADLPGVMLAGLATIGLGLVLGPEGPLIALGGALGLLAVRVLRRDAPAEVATLVAACGTFSALSLVFGSPVIAAVILIEATGLGGSRQRMLVVPGLLAAGIGSLVSIGLGSFTGLSDNDYALGALPLPAFDRPDVLDFVWTVPLGVAVALGTFAVFAAARRVERAVTPRPFLALPAAGLVVGALAIAFAKATGESESGVLFSGQEQLSGLLGGAGTWSFGVLVLLLICKGLAWAISLASFRGGPTFPAIFLGAAAGVLASHLPGFELTPAVAVGLGAAVASVLRLPLSAVVLALLLTAGTGAGAAPLVIIGVVAAYLTTLAIPVPKPDQHADERPAPSERATTVAA
jgi:H+/Cl- antiporter ClcA